MTSAKIYPKYFDYPKCEDGFDLAVIYFDNKNNYEWTSTDSVTSFYDPKKINKKIKVIGYPGEIKLNGDIYEMVGTIKKVYKREDNGYIIAYDDIDTTPGQSGSPVYLINNNSYLE